MMKIDRFPGRANVGVAILLMAAGMAVAQTPAPDAHPAVQDGFVIHNTADLGGHMANISGSGSMYDTLVNIHSGPRVLGQTFTMHALQGTKHSLLDDLNAFSSGFGGDPNNFAKLDFSKGKLYEFSGTFRRDRQYFDYDLLGNPDVPAGSIPIGPTGAFALPQANQSPFLFNTVRRMTDTNLTILPLSKVTFRAGYSQNIFQGPSMTPSGYQFAGSYSVVVEEMQRNSTDDFMGAIDWKPWQHTKLTFEEQIDHYKADSYFTMPPGSFMMQEADGTPAAPLTNYFSPSYSSTACNANSTGGTPMLSAAQGPGGLPVINAACAVTTSYLRSQPTRILYPTEIFRFQSTSINNIAMNGDVRYTSANMNLPAFYENFQGLTVATKTAPAYRSFTYTGNGSAERKVFAADYGIVWQATQKISLADQFTFSNVQQPGTTTMTGLTTLATPSTAGNETITYPGTLTVATAAAGAGTFEGSGAVGTPLPDFFGQKLAINNATATWDVSTRTTLSLTYRYRNYTIAEGIPHNAPLAAGATNNGTVTINENGGILNAALRPTNHWDINGTVEISYDDNAFTPVAPRQLKHYRVHTMYRPKPWATLSGAFNDLERHNNTNNTGTPSQDGPLQHEDHSRIVSLGASLTPSEHYGFDFNYSYSDIYTSTNICYDAAGTSALPGAASASGTACPDGAVRGTSYYMYGPVKDFMDAPTQYASVALALMPNKSIHGDIGYRISAVSGNQFFNDAQEVNGSLQSGYQTPYLNVAWTVHPGWIWSAEYDYYGYGEGGPSGAPLCSTSNPVGGSSPVAAPGVSCNSSTFAGLPTGLTEPSSGLTAPRNFHANNVTIGMHYEF